MVGIELIVKYSKLLNIEAEVTLIG